MPFLVHSSKNLHFWYNATFPLGFFLISTCLSGSLCYAVLVLVWRPWQEVLLAGVHCSAPATISHYCITGEMLLMDVMFVPGLCTSGSSFSGTGHWGIYTEPSPCYAGAISVVHCFSEPLQFTADREEGVENLLCPWTLSLFLLVISAGGKPPAFEWRVLVWKAWLNLAIIIILE